MKQPELTPQYAMERPAWEIADLLGLHYHGDSSPFDHGGIFYDEADWKTHGYSSAVRFVESEGTTWIECVTIDCDQSQCGADTTAEEIMDCYHTKGCEPDYDTDGNFSWIFTEEQEEQAWQHALNHLKSIAPSFPDRDEHKAERQQMGVTY